MPIIQVTAQKLREDGEVVSEQHLFIVGDEHDLQRDEVLMAIDFAEQNCASGGRKLYTCPKMLIEIMDVMRDKCSGRIQMERSSEDLPFASDVGDAVQDHYVLTLDSKDMFTSIEVNGVEVVEEGADLTTMEPNVNQDAPAVQATLFTPPAEPVVHPAGCTCVVCLFKRREAERAPNATMWASGSQARTWTREAIAEEKAPPQPAESGTRPQFEEGK